MSGDKTFVAIEFDSARGAGISIERYMLHNKEAREQMREALAQSGGAGTDTDFVMPIFSNETTPIDREWFEQNSHRAHFIRDAIEGECVLAGRACGGYLIIVRQLYVGFRQSIAIAARRLRTSPTTKLSRLKDNDDLLSWMFETATRCPESDPIFLDEILTFLDGQQSAVLSQGSERRPQ